MKEISTKTITDQVRKLFIKANYILPQEIKESFSKALAKETSDTARRILSILEENYKIAEKMEYPLCQDTGMAVVFMEIGQDVHITGGSVEQAVYQGVEEAYREGYLRKSVVEDPLRRVNTKNNLPPVIYQRLIEGENLTITAVPKGFGSENQSALKMMLPSSTPDDIIDFIVQGVTASGGKGCPPGILGIGIGGTFDYAAFLAKKALLRNISEGHPDPFYREIEEEIVSRLNATGIGPMGTGGKTTVLGVNILTYPTHIAGLPVAYNYCCHASRHAEVTL